MKTKQETAVDHALNANPNTRYERTDCLVFSRSCTDWDTFRTARKTVQLTTLTECQARAVCIAWNDNRTAPQIRKGTKWEFTERSNFYRA